MPIISVCEKSKKEITKLNEPPQALLALKPVVLAVEFLYLSYK